MMFMVRKKIDVLIFSDVDNDYIKEFLLEPIGLNSKLRGTRKADYLGLLKELVITPYFPIFLIKYFHIFFKEKFRRALRIILELLIIEMWKPRKVISFWDDDILFRLISLYDKSRKYYLIQNGTRFDWHIAAFARQLGEQKDFSNLTYFVFGNYEKIAFSKFGIKHRYVPVGSLRASVFKNQITKTGDAKYDICIVSSFINKSPKSVNRAYDWQRFLYPLTPDNEFYFIWRKIVNNIKLYLQEEKKKAIACFRQTEDSYEKYVFSNINNVTIQSRSRQDVYQAIQDSEIIITSGCTTLLESIGWRKKVLHIDYSENQAWSTIKNKSVWYNTVSDYQVFKDQLNNLFSIDYEKYISEINDTADYVMKYDPNESCIKKIQTELLLCD